MNSKETLRAGKSQVSLGVARWPYGSSVGPCASNSARGPRSVSTPTRMLKAPAWLSSRWLAEIPFAHNNAHAQSLSWCFSDFPKPCGRKIGGVLSRRQVAHWRATPWWVRGSRPKSKAFWLQALCSLLYWDHILGRTTDSKNLHSVERPRELE